MTTLSACPDAEGLAQLLDGLTDADTSSKLRHHLDQCERCFDIFVESRWLIHANPRLRPLARGKSGSLA